jgi:hypothetical protein
MASNDPLRFSQPPADPNPDREQLIAAAAYYIAEKRHFSPGSEVRDWLEAEAQVDKDLAEKRLSNIMTKPKPKARAKAQKQG